MYKLVVFVPSTHCERVKEELFKAGAGKIGNYDCCSFEIEGTGQFRPLQGANPFLGKENLIEKVKETRIEMVCERSVIKRVVSAIKSCHPYETPAYDITEIIGID